MSPTRPIYLCGPTASGKSSLAVALAERIGGEVVNGDAFQLYRGLPIVTAAPTREETERVPHHLFGTLDPAESCDAMRFRQMALPVIDGIVSRGKTPVVAGGSGLYLKFLTHGPSPLPAGDPALRRELDELPLDTLVARLRELDPPEAERTHLANRRYVTRALEICLLTGRRCSELRDGWESRGKEIESTLLGIFIRRERPDLHHRIAERTRRMLDSGAIREVSALTAAAPGLLKAIGVPQIREHLDGVTSADECRERIEAATRQYAKRQETWFRREPWLLPLVWKPGAPVPVEAALSLLSKASTVGDCEPRMDANSRE